MKKNTLYIPVLTAAIACSSMVCKALSFKGATAQQSDSTSLSKALAARLNRIMISEGVRKDTAPHISFRTTNPSVAQAQNVQTSIKNQL